VGDRPTARWVAECLVFSAVHSSPRHSVGHCSCLDAQAGHCACLDAQAGHCACLDAQAGYCACLDAQAGYCACLDACAMEDTRPACRYQYRMPYCGGSGLLQHTCVACGGVAPVQQTHTIVLGTNVCRLDGWWRSQRRGRRDALCPLHNARVGSVVVKEACGNSILTLQPPVLALGSKYGQAFPQVVSNRKEKSTSVAHGSSPHKADECVAARRTT
jgi:hypothetical protein